MRVQDAETIVRRLSLLEKAALLSGADTWQTRAIPRLGLPAIWMADGPHGVRKQLGPADHLGLSASEPATCFPTAAAVANAWDEDLAEEIGAAMGREAAAQGVDVLLGPGLNIKRSPLGGRGFEYYSEDPELSGRLAAATVRGIQSRGVAATPKHFAVNSQELRRMVSDSIVDERTMREVYLTAFEIVVREAQPWALMSSYNLVNGVYTHEHRELLQGILREEWGFSGAVVSDWGGSDDAVAAARAGGTIEMPSPGFDSVREICAAVAAGELAESAVDARVAELVELVLRVRERGAPDPVDPAAHHALARRAAAASAVLLRNEHSLLPLAAGTRIALIGEFARMPRIQGAGSSSVNATRIDTLADAVADTPLAVVASARGYRRDGIPDAALVAEAVTAAAAAEVVLLALGQTEAAESEGLDRSDLDLPEDQVALLRAVAAVNPRTVVLLTAGGAVTMPWISAAAALLHTSLAGQAGASGILDVVTGTVPPVGRLAETFPLALSDTPTAASFPSAARTADYREGPFVGYRWYESAAVPVAFPFGFGLGYTTFAYSDLEVRADAVSVTVTNTGTSAGTDVPQVYIGLAERVPGRPVRELKGWTRVTLAAGESARVRVALGERAFRAYDTGRRAWIVEAGDYVVHLAHDAHDTALSAPLRIEGDTLSVPTPPAPAATDAEFAALLGRPVPSSRWGSGPLGPNDPVARLRTARSPLARWGFRLLDARLRRAERAGEPEITVLFLLNAPFRMISKMSGGFATTEVMRAVLVAVNGRTLRGIVRTVGALVRGRRDERRSRAAFARAASGTVRGGRGR